MYALMQHHDHKLPTVVSMLSTDYLDLSFAGYETLDTGTKKRMDSQYKELMESFVDELELNNEEN